MMHVATYIESTNDFNFFRRFVPGLKRRGVGMVFLLNKLSLALKCKYHGIPFEIVQKVLPGGVSTAQRRDLEQMHDVIAHELTLDEASLLFDSVQTSFTRLSQKFPLLAVFIMNGASIPTRAVAEMCRQQNIAILFFELANIPGKMFVDPIGVNAESSIYGSIEKLHEFHADDGQYEQWRTNFLKEGASRGRRRKRIGIKNLLFLLDIAGFRFFNIPANGQKSLLRKINYVTNSLFTRIAYDHFDIQRRRYVFFPLQLTYDTQLLVNSPVSTADAISIASERAKQMGVSLVVKIHPLENNPETIATIQELRGRYGFFLVNNNTLDLVQHSVKVITINSTVGLEALICEKEVDFLGRSFYAKLTKDLLKNYILGYLVDLDYSSPAPVEEPVLAELFKRSRVQVSHGS